MAAGTICLRVRGSVDAGLPPVEVLELCDSGGHVVSGRAVILVEALCVYRNDGASRDDITTAIATLEELYRRITRIYGATHPQTRGTQDYLEKARHKLAHME